MKTVMDNDTALIELMGIAEFFEIKETDGSLESLITTVQEGRLYVDEDQKRVIYKFNKPIELQNGKEVKELKIKNPTSDESIRINKGITAKADKSGMMEIDMGMLMEKAIKAASILSDQPLGVLNRMSRSDLSDLMEIFNFF